MPAFEFKELSQRGTYSKRLCYCPIHSCYYLVFDAQGKICRWQISFRRTKLGLSETKKQRNHSAFAGSLIQESFHICPSRPATRRSSTNFANIMNGRIRYASLYFWTVLLCMESRGSKGGGRRIPTLTTWPVGVSRMIGKPLWVVSRITFLISASLMRSFSVTTGLLITACTCTRIRPQTQLSKSRVLEAGSSALLPQCHHWFAHQHLTPHARV